MEPIARYSERRFEGRRDFQLFGDRVLIIAKDYMGSESESSVMLDSMVPVLSRGRARSSAFSWAVMMVFIPIGLLQSDTLDLFSYWGGIAFSIGVAGVLVGIVTFRKIEWVSLNSTVGILSLAIVKSGPDVASFDAFVERLRAQVITATERPARQEMMD